MAKTCPLSSNSDNSTSFDMTSSPKSATKQIGVPNSFVSHWLKKGFRENDEQIHLAISLGMVVYKLVLVSEFLLSGTLKGVNTRKGFNFPISIYTLN